MTETKTYESIADRRQLSREEWLELRQTGLGGHDASAALGINPYFSAAKCFLSKIEPVKSEDPHNEPMEWGTRLQSVIQTKLSEVLGETVDEDFNVYRSTKYPWMLANLDCITSKGIPCEIKTSSRSDAWQDGPPPEVLAQVDHYMCVLSAPYSYVAVLLNGRRFKHFKVERNAQREADLVEAEERLWQLIEAKMPPPMAGQDLDLLAHMYPVSTEREVKFTEDFVQTFEQLTAAKGLVKTWGTVVSDLEAKIKEQLKDAERGVCGKFSAKWKGYETTSFDSARFKEERPTVYAEYSKTKTIRRFTVTKIGDENDSDE